MRQRSSEYLTLAQRKISDATLARNEGDLRFLEAEEALKKEDFETARKKLEVALSKYDESLSYLNDEEVRSQWDSKLFDLGNRITKSENLIVVREVRELKTLAKDAYFNGRFEDAENALSHALKLNPVSTRAIYEISEIYKTRGDLDKFYDNTISALR